MPDEDHKERVDRELLELLGELRVAIPGVQVLFAFLLTAPFNQRFQTTTSFQRGVFLAALLTCAAASALLVAPAAQHRLLFRAHEKDGLLRRGNRMAIGGFAALAISIASGILLITNFMFGNVVSAVVTAAVTLVFGWLWFGMALANRGRGAPE